MADIRKICIFQAFIFSARDYIQMCVDKGGRLTRDRQSKRNDFIRDSGCAADIYYKWWLSAVLLTLIWIFVFCSMGDLFLGGRQAATPPLPPDIFVTWPVNFRPSRKGDRDSMNTNQGLPGNVDGKRSIYSAKISWSFVAGKEKYRNLIVF